MSLVQKRFVVFVFLLFLVKAIFILLFGRAAVVKEKVKMAVFRRKLLVSTIVIVLNLMLVTSSVAYKPVLIIHGIWDKAISLDFMADRIRNVCIDLLLPSLFTYSCKVS